MATFDGDGNNNVINGKAGADVIRGLSGNDTVSAGAGNDSVYGGYGDDSLNGEAGQDRLDGGRGNDTIDGGADNDFITGGYGNDSLRGGTGNNTIYGDQAPITGFGQSSTPFRVNEVISGYQSPPKTVVLDDGRVLHVWINDALSDGSTSAEIQTRIYEADGTPATGQISLDALAAVDGYDGFDWASLDVDTLPNGNVMLSYVISGGDAGTGREAPVFAIVEPTESGVTIVTPTTWIPQVGGSVYQSPPVTTVLDNGNVMFVWSENAISDGVTTVLNGRVYDPVSGTFGNQFPVGNVAVDGTNPADVPNMEVVQLENGNVVVSYVRSAAETAAGGNEPVFTILDSSGNTIKQSTEFQQTDTTTYESPAVITAMDDGNFMGIWINNGYSDDTNTMKLEGRIFDPNGNPLTGDISLNGSAFSVDGWNSYDIPNFSIDTLDSNHIVVSYVNGTINGGAGADKSHFTILDVTDPANPVITAQDVRIPVSPNHPYSGPALIEVLGDSGNFVAVYGDDNAASGGAYGLNYRSFDVNGNPLTGDVMVTAGGSLESAVSGLDNFDWNNIDVDYNATNNTFVISWAGANDGSGTGVYSSGPIAAPGGVLSDDSLAGYDTIDGGVGNDAIYGAGGDDSLLGGAGNDTLYGGAGDDTLTIAQGDVAYGDAGDDLFYVVDLAEPSAGVITIDGGTEGETGGDTLNLGGLAQPGLRSVTETAPGEYAGYFTLLDGTTVNFTNINNIICFAQGTTIDTPSGLRAIETLNRGDLVRTLDQGFQPIKWIGNRIATAQMLETSPKNLPIRIPAHALGKNMPSRDLLVSPQHRVLVANAVAARMFGTPQVMVPAKILSVSMVST